MKITLPATDWWNLLAPLIPVQKSYQKLFPWEADRAMAITVDSVSGSQLRIRAIATDRYVVVATQVFTEVDGIDDMDEEIHLIPEKVADLITVRPMKRRKATAGQLQFAPATATATVTDDDGSESIMRAVQDGPVTDLWKLSAKWENDVAEKVPVTSTGFAAHNLETLTKSLRTVSQGRSIVRLTGLGFPLPTAVQFDGEGINADPTEPSIKAFIMPANI